MITRPQVSLRSGSLFTAVAMLVTLVWFPALVNPSLQPKNLFDRYVNVLALRVSAIDAASGTITFAVEAVDKGEFAARSLTLTVEQATAPSDAARGVPPRLQVGAIAVAFAGKRQQNHENDILLYVGDHAWHEATAPDPAQPAAWRWLRHGNESLVGTFNGDAARFVEMMAEVKAGIMFFPAKPLVGFADDVAVGTLPGAGRGIMVLDLDGDGRLDIVACSTTGARAFVQVAPWRFEDRTVALGLDGATGESCSFADIDGEGRPDLLIGATLWRNQGEHYVATELLPADLANGLTMAVFAEIDGDGRPDVVAAVRERGLRLFINQQGAAFRETTAAAGLERKECGHRDEAVGFIACGDWNGDGRTDIYFGTGRGLILLQDAAGVFAPLARRPHFTYASGPQLLPGLTGAGQFAPVWRTNESALVAPTDSGTVIATEVRGAPADVAPLGGEIAVGGSRQLAMLAEDLDMDGYVDLYSTSWDADTAGALYTNRGYGSFMKTELYLHDVFPGQAHHHGAWGAVAADLDGDGANDLVLCGIDGHVTAMPSRAIALQAPGDNPTWHEAKAQQVHIIAVEVKGRLGVCNAVVRLRDGSGALIMQRVIGAQYLTGCRGPDAVNLAIRELGNYVIEVAYADGETRRWPVTVSASSAKRLPLIADRDAAR